MTEGVLSPYLTTVQCAFEKIQLLLGQPVQGRPHKAIQGHIYHKLQFNTMMYIVQQLARGCLMLLEATFKGCLRLLELF